VAQRDKLQSILFQSVRDYAVQTGLQVEVTEDMRLLGRDALLDSLGLVIILASFEADINDTFGTEVVLADERAMSMERSPFRTVSSLVDYACTLLDENGKGS
jgi:acyl carrier protein